MKKVLVWGIVLIIITIGIYLLNKNANANQCNENNPKNCPIPTEICNNGEHIGNPHCESIATPTVNSHCKEWKYEEDCITPTISPSMTPQASPSASPVPNTQTSDTAGASGGQSNNPPPVSQCQNESFAGPVIVSFTDKGNGTVNFAWTAVQTYDKLSMTFGLTPDNLNMGEDNIPGNVTNWDIHQLPIGSHVWAQVQAWFHGCEESSNVYDPVIR